MPELPEVETTRRGIEPHIVGQQVDQLIVRQPKLRWPVPEQLSDYLKGKIIESVQRRGVSIGAAKRVILWLSSWGDFLRVRNRLTRAYTIKGQLAKRRIIGILHHKLGL